MHQQQMARFFSLLGLNLLVVVVLAVGVWTLWKLRSWWREDANDAETDHEILARYREMRLRGELSEEEYRSIKSQMAARLGMARDAPRPAQELRPRMAGPAPAATSGDRPQEPPATDDEHGRS